MLDVDSIEVSPSSPPHSHLSNQYLKHAHRVLKCSMTVWLVLETLTLVMLGLCCTNELLPFATLNTVAGCGSINPLTNREQTIFFMSLFEGFSSNSKLCENSSENFCLPWTSPLWAQFEHYPNSSGQDDLSVSTSKAIYSGQILFVLTLAFLLASWIILIVALKYIGKSSVAYPLYLSVGYTLLVAFTMAMCSLASISSSAPYSQRMWEVYFSRDDNILAKKSTLPLVPCQPTILYKGGGLFAGAVAILLVLAIWSMFSACLQGSHIFHKLHNRSGSTRADSVLEMTSRDQSPAIKPMAA